MKKSACSAFVLYRVPGRLTNAAATPCDSNPGDVRCSFRKLINNRLEPTSNTTESATSTTISVDRKRPCAPDDPRAASFRAPTISVRDDASAGARPTSSALTIVTAAANPSALQFSVSTAFGGSCEATSDWIADRAATASAIPRTPAIVENIRL